MKVLDRQFDTVLELSQWIHSVARDHGCRRALLGFHAYRYLVFVQNSSRGPDCTYARATARLVPQELHDLELVLKEIL